MAFFRPEKPQKIVFVSLIADTLPRLSGNVLKPLELGRQTNLTERLTKLKRRTTPIAHVDQHVENP